MARPEEVMPHQDKVEAVVDAHVTENITTYLAAASDNAAIADPASPGASYVQAEVVALRTAIVAILNVMREAGLIPT
jgi:hypothetical protein